MTDRAGVLKAGFGERIRYAADRVASRRSAATAAGVSEDMLYRYIREQGAPSFAAMAGLAAAAKVRLEWLATGEGEADQASADADVDLALLERVAESAFEELEDRQLQLLPSTKARLIRVLYWHFASRNELPDRHTVSNIIDLTAS